MLKYQVCILKKREKIDQDILLTRLKSGSGEAFKTLFNKYSDRLYQVALQYVRNEDDSKE